MKKDLAAITISSMGTIVLLSIPLVHTTWVSIQRRSEEHSVRKVLRRHPDLGEIRTLSVIAAPGGPRVAVELHAQEPPSQERIHRVREDLQRALGRPVDLRLTVLSARIL